MTKPLNINNYIQPLMKALLDIPQDVNQTLNIVKAQYNLKNKVQAITLVVNSFKQDHMEPELRPEFIQKILAGERKPGIPFTSVAELRKRYK
jgi:hypothetical protein